jgi:ribonuclease HI
MIYASELTWTGRGPMEREYQLAINQMARNTLGCLPSTPLGALIRESNLTPAAPLLDHRQAQFALRLLSRPPDHGGPEEILENRGTQLTERLRANTGLRSTDSAEVNTMPEGMRTKAKIVMLGKEEAEEAAKDWRERTNTAYTDGSRLDNKKVGAAVAWARPGGEDEEPEWTGESWHLGNNKEVFDAELYALWKAAQRFNGRQHQNENYTIFTDSQAAILRCKNDAFGPGQHLAKLFIQETEALADRGCTTEVRWVPSHVDVAGNEAADKMAKEAANNSRKPSQKHTPFRTRTTASQTYLKRVATEKKQADTKEWITTRIRERKSYTPPKKSGFRKELKKEKKRLAARFYQLNTGHCLTAPYLKRIKKTDSDLCWWCEDGRSVQTRHHLFTECREFRPQIRRLWKSVGDKLNWKHPRSKKISDLFSDDRVTKDVLRFLKDTGVGKVKTGALGGPVRDYWEDVARARWGTESESEGEPEGEPEEEEEVSD